MIDLYKLSMDIRNERSEIRKTTNKLISDIFYFLDLPSEKTRSVIEGWKNAFEYIYGDVETNLSSNSKLDKKAVFDNYGIKLPADTCPESSLLLLFFSIQTYFSLLIKYIMAEVMPGIKDKGVFSHREIITGEFAEKYGIKNYCIEDLYCWPVFELDNGFDAIMDKINSEIRKYRTDISISDFRNNNNFDHIKQMYEAVIPKEIRHALGEYYTPDWLAEETLDSAVKMSHVKDIGKVRIIDPTCGSGTFLAKAIALKRRHNADLNDIISSVYGIDINPLAVLTAKTNYILSLIDLITGETEFSIPVFNADMISACCSENDIQPEPTDFFADPIGQINYRLGMEKNKVRHLNKADMVIGNPPWVNWEYMPEKYRQGSQHLWTDYKLFNATGRKLSFSKEDISVLITYIAMDKLLNDKGIIGFVIRQAVFKSAQNGVGFRKFMIKDEIPVKVIRVEDLSKIKAFDNATNSTALFFAKKGEKTDYPVPYYFWEKRKDIRQCSFTSYSALKEVRSQFTITELSAVPAVKDDETSVWLTTGEQNLRMMKKLLGTNEYRARTGVFTGGANAVYWLNVTSENNGYVTITNVTDRAKRKSEKLTCEIEPEHVYPMLKGSNVKKWNTSYDTYILCPHTKETKMWPVPQNMLSETAPKTLGYLEHFRADLDDRNGFAGWENEIRQKEFHAILRIGEYTFSEYKVIWKYIATEFICAVIGRADDKYLGNKPILPNEKIMYISTDSEYEAYYLCGVLSSTLISECVKSYMNPTGISAHVLNKLNIPKYDSNDPIHTKIAEICKEGHGKTSILKYISAIDECVREMYDPDPSE